MTTTGGRVFDGGKWEDVSVENGSPVAPPVASEGSGEIFVSVASFRDGARCGRTLKNLFENAQDPSKVIVGVIEQNDGKDKRCLAEYCKLQGVTGLRPKQYSVASPELKSRCPHYDRIRYVAVYDIAAKGPSYARSLARKILADEEFCMQIDSHADFTRSWDALAKDEWTRIGNEYGVLSGQPAPLSEKADREPGGSKSGEVPRQCAVNIGPEGIPMYENPADGYLEHVDRPLLSRTWSAGFSFAKCHLEEAAPYDNFAPQLFDAEQFPRFVRFWTRGYDSYTPSRNIVYHDFGPNPDGVDPLNWAAKGYPNPKTQRQRALKRIKTLLGISGGDMGPTAMANLGLYGIGRRRTMKQLEEFVGIDLIQKRSNAENKRCGTLAYVPYDSSISPLDNMYDNPDDLDPQPEYPLHTPVLARKFGGGDGGGAKSPLLGDAGADVPMLDADQARKALEAEAPAQRSDDRVDAAAASAPIKTLATLWFFGLFVWYMVFVGTQKAPSRSGGSAARQRRRARAAAASGAKDH